MKDIGNDSGDTAVEELVMPFLSRAYEHGQLLGEYPELWELFIDLEAMREHVDRVQTWFDTVPDERLSEQYLRWFFKVNTFCSLYQLGETPDSELLYETVDTSMRIIMEEGEWKPVFNGLLFSATLSGRIAVDIIQWFTEAERENLEQQLDTGDKGLALSLSLARYLITTDFFDMPVDEELVEQARAERFAGDRVHMRETLDQEVLYDLVSANLLGIEPDLDQLRVVLAASWTNERHYRLSDCESEYCQMKSFQLLARLDYTYPVLEEAQMINLAAYYIESVSEEGAYTFPEDFGLEAASLWNTSGGCDFLCSPRHWGVTMGGNHLLHRLDELDKLDAVAERIAALQSATEESE